MCEFYHIPMLSKSAATQTEPGASAERVKILHIQHKDTNIQPCIRKPDLKRRQRVWVFLYRVILWCSVHAYLLTPMQKLPKTLFLNGILLNSKYCTAMLLTGRIFFLSLFSTSFIFYPGIKARAGTPRKEKKQSCCSNLALTESTWNQVS